jgi:hypothetical protein
LLVILFAIANIIGASMWDMAEQMQDWWDSEWEDENT